MTAPATTAAADPWLAHSAHILLVTREAPGVCTYHIQLDDPAVREAWQARAGQFTMLYVPGLGEAAISLCGVERGLPTIPHTIRAAGNVTQAITEMGAGAAIGVRGPFGRGWPMEECEGRDVVLVAGGIGLAPLRAAITEILADRDRYGAVRLLCGARSPAGLLYRSEHEYWRANGIAVSTTVDRATDNWGGNVGVVTVLLERMPLPAPENTVLLTCGPEVMMWYTIRTALDRGLSPTSMWLSLERNMNCAIGLCGHCQFGPQFICRDGPVLRFDRVESILRTDDL